MSTFSGRFWDRLCGFREQLFLLLVFDILLLVLALVALPFVDPNSASGVLLRIDVGLFVMILVPLGYVQFRCRRRSASETE